MFVKSIKLVGFKSFADRTHLEFEPGVSVIVGPNGSGKSNIVDAVAWVMGTQSTRSLRTEKMEDVIFAGTAARPALGRAEVQLLFDNSDRDLPLDLDEVSVTRRLYRDGTSEYHINGMECRLIDVQELLSDSGVGRQQHVIVGQGQIDSILNAKTDQHRQVIEEAAGILKHRMRKDRAIRRLERTDADVLRLHDILRELKRQMRPLRRQAEAAERHDGVRDALIASRLYLGGSELRSIRTRAGEATEEDAALETRVTDAQQRLRELDVQLEALTVDAGQAGRDLDRDTAAAARLETTAERLRRIGQVAHERARAVESRLQGAGARRRDLQDEARTLEVELGQSGDVERKARHEAELREQHLRTIEDQEQLLSEQESMPAEGALAMSRGDLRSLEAAEGRDVREREDLDRRAEMLQARQADELAEVERINDDIRSTDEMTATAQIAYERATEVRLGEQTTWETAEATFRALEVDLAAATARRDALDAAAGDDPALRASVEGADGSIGAAAGLLDVPSDIAAAVDAALETWAAAVVVDRPDAVSGIVDMLRSAGGSIPVVHRMQGLELRGSPLDGVTGVDRLVDRLGPGADTFLAGMLLGDVAVVADWRAGWDLVQREPGIRAVTESGDLVSVFGVRLADTGAATPAVRDAAHGDVERLTHELERARGIEDQHHRAFDAARETERIALESLEALETRLNGAAEALDRLQRSSAATGEELGRLAGRREMLDQAAQRRLEQVTELRTRLSALEGEEAERQALWEQFAQQRQDLIEQRSDARRAREEAAESYGAIVERRRMLETRLRAVRAELQDLTQRPADPENLQMLRDVETRAKVTLEIVRDKIGELRSRQVHLREVAGEAGRQLAEARQEESQLRTMVDAAKERRSALAVEATELRMREEAVAEALRRDADATEEAALAAPRPDVPEDVDLEAHVEALDAELRRMGPINPLAAEEYRELDERHTHIADQLGDLEASRDELRKVITVLDSEIEQLFVSAFEEVQRNYEEFFSILFPGGRGRLALTDPSKPLETGLEIGAQPMGKRVSKLSLLSGGERSLAALAFLFAVFKARPSPFYIMDEVEAALDDANLRRFLTLIARFRGSAQLLIVTHQQQTMEAADVLYGVTMEPGGSSQALARRMEEIRLDV